MPFAILDTEDNIVWTARDSVLTYTTEPQCEPCRIMVEEVMQAFVLGPTSIFPPLKIISDNNNF